MKHSLIALFSAAALLGACQQGTNGGGGIAPSDVGTILGGAAGAWAGSNVGGGVGQTVATAMGTLLGATLGRTVGENMDNSDLNYYHNTSQKALETGQPGEEFSWERPSSQLSGQVIPSGYYKNAEGTYCREYSQKVTVNNRVEEGHGVACRQPDGSWEIEG